MKPDKGLYQDARPVEQPEGTYPFGKNGIQFDKNGARYNEPGFSRLLSQAPYHVIGQIETDKYPVIISTDNTNSAFGFLDVVNDKYIPIIDDATWNVFDDVAQTQRSRIGLNTSNYLTGQYTRNYKAELVIAVTDKVLFPIYLNCDNPSVKSLEDLHLFATFQTPDIEVTMGSGGIVKAGAYYVAVGYEKNDGTSTQYADPSNVTVVTPGSLEGSADKTLEIVVNNVDTNYNYLRMAIISKIDGITNAIELTDYIPITGDTVTFTYTGNELSSTIDVAQVLTPPVTYDRVKAIGQLNDYLYLYGLHIQPDIDDMQSYALQVKLEWESLLIDAMNPPADHVSGKKKGFAHEEVYAFYLRYRKTKALGGGFSKWFHIAGPKGDASILSSEALAGSLGSVPAFKVEDQIPYYVDLTGGFGPYLNDTEKYPDTADYDLTAFGGENLRNQAVRHHKTPSQRWCKLNLYGNIADYGRNQLDLLGLRVLNVQIPDKYKGQIDGYEIGYAIRTVGNMTNVGQGIVLHTISDGYTKNTPTNQAPLYTSGGNYKVTVFKGSGAFGDDNKELQYPRLDTFRIHPFDVLFNSPSITPNYISAQWCMQRQNLNDASTPVQTSSTNPPPVNNYIEDGDVSGNNTGPLEYIIDYTTGDVPNPPSKNNFLRSITSSFYTPNNTNVGNFINGRHETAFCGYLAKNIWNYPNNTFSAMGLDYSTGNTHNDKGLRYEQAFMVNLMQLRTDVYQSFYSQTITLAGSVIDLSDNTVPTLWGGDVFINPYTFHTYGRYNSADEAGDKAKGIKIVRRIVCESVSNINLRFVDPANQYSDFWPKTPLTRNDITNYITLFDRSLDPNQFGYSKSFNALNDLVSSVIWSPFQENIYDATYRIHRGGKASRTGRPRSWRTFLALDYYEMVKTMGLPVHIEGMDDRLIIHNENAMFLTQDKSKLESGLISITLGAGDIFQFEPQETVSSKLGYAGTQHDLACVRTPFGYIFVDAKQGEIYLYKQKLTLLNEGLNTFLRDFLKLPDVNNYMGNGITIGWDQRFKRIILTVKNKQLPDGTTVIPFQDTNEFWASIAPGQIVSYQGRYIEFIGTNTSSYQCPPDPIQNVTTWQPVDSYCVKDSNGNNTTIQAYNNRIRLINGSADGYKEPNTPGGLGTYFPPVSNTVACPLPPPVITWVGSGGTCLKDDVPTCATGFTYDPVSQLCKQVLTQPAIPPTGSGGSQGVVAKANSVQWNNGGAKLITSFNSDGSATSPSAETLLLTPHFWINGNHAFDSTSRNLVDSRMNVAGIWVQGGMVDPTWTPTNEFIGFSRKFTVSAAHTVYIGMSADNTFRIALNGVTIIDTTPNNGNIEGGPNFNYLNIYPVQLIAGDNYIEMWAENFGLVSGFAVEIYDVSLDQLNAAATETDLNIIFSTKNMIGQNFDLGQTIGYSCPDGWAFDNTTNTCVQINTAAPTVAPGSTNNGLFLPTNRCRYINGVADGYCEPNTSDGTGQGPFLPATANSACNPVTPPSGSTININGTIDVQCSDDDCTNIGHAEVTLLFPSNQVLPASFNLLFGQVIQFGNTTLYYVGGSIMGSPPGIADPNYVVNGAAVPFFANIKTSSLSVITAPVAGIGITLTFLLQKNDVSQGQGVWICNNCNMPITDIYIQIEAGSIDPTDPNTYVLNLTSFTGALNIHNV